MTDALPPIPFRWDGESMAPLNQHWARRADAAYTVGETYLLVPHEERSPKSHKHYFACVRELWENLPDNWSARLPTPDHARKFALIQTGYRDERSITCASKAEAQRVAAFVRPMDDYAVVCVEGALVIVLTAKSQNLKAMDRKTFGASKTAVLDYLSDLVGVDRASVEDHARRAA